MTKLVLIDGNAIMHRAFHALPPLTDKKGTPIGAVHGFTSMLLKVIEDLKPTHLAVAFDRKEPTFRKEISKQYQAHRPEMDTGLIPQFPKIKKLLQAMNIPTYEQAGYEADDVIGTIVYNTKADEAVIVTGDRDILQLVTKKVKVYLPLKGLSVAKLMNEADVKEKLSVNPDQVVDYKALVGDPSDNYKGVPGIGPKTAINLLQEYHSLKNIYDHLDALPPKISEKLIKNKGSALLSQNLAQIMKNVPFDFNLDSCGNWQINSPQAFKVMDTFGFKTLPRRVERLSKKLISQNQMNLL
jgi:DNA polymerase-1